MSWKPPEPEGCLCLTFNNTRERLQKHGKYSAKAEKMLPGAHFALWLCTELFPACEYRTCSSQIHLKQLDRPGSPPCASLAGMEPCRQAWGFQLQELGLF